MKKIRCLFLLLLFSCKRGAPNCRIYVADILKDNPRKVYVAYRKKDTILGISDYGRDKTKRGAYYFSAGGELESYKFFETDSAYDYDTGPGRQPSFCLVTERFAMRKKTNAKIADRSQEHGGDKAHSSFFFVDPPAVGVKKNAHRHKPARVKVFPIGNGYYLAKSQHRMRLVERFQLADFFVA